MGCVEEAGFGLQLSINVPANLLPNIPINALVTAHRPQSEKWPGLILELTEDQIVRDFSAIRQGIEIERHRHSDR